MKEHQSNDPVISEIILRIKNRNSREKPFIQSMVTVMASIKNSEWYLYRPHNLPVLVNAAMWLFYQPLYIIYIG